MKGEITFSLKPPLTKRPSVVGYWKVNEMPGSNKCLRQKYKLLNFWGKKIWGNCGKRAKSKWKRKLLNRWNRVSKRGLLLMVQSHELWTLKPKLWTSQIWTLINNFVIVLVCARCLMLITLEENIRSVQQLPFAFHYVFAFSSEVLNKWYEKLFWRSCFSRCSL